MAQDIDDSKAFSIRLPKETWKFLKIYCLDREETMNHVINRCIDKFKKKVENRLTDKNTVV
jgi:hypothetical protein